MTEASQMQELIIYTKNLSFYFMFNNHCPITIHVKQKKITSTFIVITIKTYLKSTN